MYIRESSSYRDEPHLIDLAVNAFGVRSETVQDILDSTDKIIVFCNRNDKIIGFLCYRFTIKNAIFINYAVLDPEYQGKGIASSFLPVLTKYARNQGIKIVTGFVSNNNLKAFNIFTSWGFKPISSFNDGVLIGTII